MIIVYFILILQLLSRGLKRRKRLIRFFVFPYLFPALIVITIRTIFLDAGHLLNYIPALKKSFLVNLVKYLQWLLFPENLTILKAFIRRFPVFSYTISLIALAMLVIIAVKYLRISPLNLTLLVIIIILILFEAGCFSLAKLYIPSMLFCAFIPLVLRKKMSRNFQVSFHSALILLYIMLALFNIQAFKIATGLADEIINKAAAIKYDTFYVTSLPRAYRSKIPVFINEKTMNHALEIHGKSEKNIRILNYIFIEGPSQKHHESETEENTIRVEIETNANQYISLDEKVCYMHQFREGEKYSDEYAEYIVTGVNRQGKISSLEITVKDWFPVYEYSDGNLLLLRE